MKFYYIWQLWLNYLFSKEKGQISPEEFEKQFQNHLNMVEIPLVNNEFEYFWQDMRSDEDLCIIVEIAIWLLNIPCSEAAIELLFSHLKYLFGLRNTLTSPIDNTRYSLQPFIILTNLQNLQNELVELSKAE